MAIGTREKIIDIIRERIASGSIAPGSLLSETALAEEFNASRTPVREALKQLETEGLVEIRSRVGTFVAAPTRLEINELFEVKEILEGAAARLFAARGNIPELALLRENVILSDAAIARGDLASYARLVHEYHDLILRGAGNSKLSALHKMLMNQMLHTQFVHLTVHKSGRAKQSDHEHHGVLDCIEARDSSTAERLMREHIRASHQALMEQLEFEGPEHRLVAKTRTEIEKD
jgi:DNA-binding GntR family transcriptional regulator